MRYYPAGNLALIILPDHALIGVTATESDDLTVDSERGKLVLLEVAGPAVIEVYGDSTCDRNGAVPDRMGTINTSP